MTRFTLLLLASCLTACGGGDPISPYTPDTTPARTLRGRAESPESGATSATVTAWRMGADGRLTAASSGSVTTDEDGDYALSLDDATSAALVVEVTFADGTLGTALASGAASEGDATFAPDLSGETAGEAALYVLVAADGAMDADETGSMFRAFVTAEVAAAVEAADDEERAEVGATVAAAVGAWEACDSEAAEAGIAGVIEATAASDAEGGGGLDASAVISGAWSAAGADATDLAYASAAALDASLTVDGGTPGGAAESAFLGDLRAELAADVLTDAAAVLDAGSTGGALDLDAVVDASLDGDLGVMLASLGVTLSATQLAVLEDEVTVVADAHADLVGALDSADPEDVGAVSAEAVGSFRARMESEVTADLTASGAFDAEEASAAASILAQVSVIR